MIQSIRIDNFKALNDVEISFSPFTILIGDNSVGKTSVLQAIAFLKYSCTSSFDKFLDERRMAIADLCSKFSAKRSIIFSTVLLLNDNELRWDITIARGKNHLALAYEKVFVNGKVVLSYNSSGSSYRVNAKTGEKDPVMSGSFNNSIIRFTDEEKQADIYPELASIKRFFSNMETLDLLSPYNMRGTSQGESDVIGLTGEKLSSFVKGLSLTDRDTLAKDIQKFIAPFSAVIPKTKQYGWVHLEAQETYGEKTIDVSSSNISDGILRIIAFCSLRFLNNSNGAILLDEIEDGINNEHLELLVQVLQQIQAEKNVQIIATTHNTVLLDYWVDKKEVDLDTEPDEKARSSIVFLYRDDSGGVVAKNIFSSALIRDMLSYMFPGEIILNMTNKQIKTALSGGTEQ